MSPFEILRSQSTFVPEIINREHLVVSPWTLIAALGGSSLAGLLLRDLLLDQTIEVHSAFDLPLASKRRAPHLIASSASGNILETLSSFEAARSEGLSRAVVAGGGELLARAERDAVPYVRFPETGVPAREAIIFSLLSHLALLGREGDISHLREAIEALDTKSIEEEGNALAEFLSSSIPLLYAPDSLHGLMRFFKINFNETARVQSFISLLPEAHHEDIAGFDGTPETNALSKSLVVLLFVTPSLDIRLSARVDVLQVLLREYGVRSRIVRLPDSSWLGTVHGIGLAMHLAHILRERAGIENSGANLVAEFKKRTLNLM